MSITNENDQKIKKKKLKGNISVLSWSFMAGAIAGIMSKSCTAPMDRIKIIFQVSEKKFSFIGATNLGKKIIKEEGFTALFRGNTATVLRVMPYAGIQHASFDYFKKIFGMYNNNNNNNIDKYKYYNDDISKIKNKRLTNMQLVLAGSLAGASSVALTYPLDTLRARMVVQQGKRSYRGLFDALITMYKTEGARSFTRGIVPTLLGILPYTGIGFALNETLKRHAADFRFQNNKSKSSNSSELPTYVKFTCSYFAACIAQSATYPLDTIRRRMQTHGYTQGIPGIDYSKMYTTAKIILQREGIQGFFKGLSVNWIRSPLATGISLTTYDIVKEFLNVEKL